jgi:hypothetical protein
VPYKENFEWNNIAWLLIDITYISAKVGGKTTVSDEVLHVLTRDGIGSKKKRNV